MSWDIHDLFRRHAAEINRGLRRRGMSSEVAADLTQDTFLRLLGALERRTAEADNPRAYLFQISRNLAVDYARRERLMPRADTSDAFLNAFTDPSPAVDTIVYDRQRLAIVQQALLELPERTRRAFEMHRLQEQTLAEIAPIIGLSTTRTWGLIRDAYRHIRARLHENDALN
ncbi:RNA polymerase sigma factor [Devosia alba]|uniref:RNA polymerase sigma factor n=1 Tax=Devosia alba TaxID=3152360 RepID=UPI0032658C70